ncbi:MAG: winged helix-turn-helix transcriptional regulator [Methanomassiliicoccales archaeon]|nr:MAG: winged helix-turn-helix transcriptional regulator [Methanomassiliicoccales archaeon]
MSKKKLTKKEQDTLWALINYPTLNDNALAKKTRLKLSTITAIRRRLWERGFYRTVNIPNFFRLGYELFTVHYGTFNEAVPVEKRIKYFKNYIDGSPNIIFSMMGRANGIVLNVERNYAEANEHYENLEMFFNSHHLTDEGGWKKAIFPFQTAKFWNFFDFSPTVRYAYDIKRKINLPEFISDKNKKVIRLSKKEKRVLRGLVKYPEDSDNSIADKTDVSRQAVSNIKKRFMSEHLLYVRRIMNFEHMGCNLIPFAYTYFGPMTPMEARKDGLDYTKRSVPIFLGISSNFENIVFATTKNYPEYEKLREKLLSFYKTHLSIAKPPEALLFTVDDLCYCKNLTFADLLDDMFEREEEMSGP